MKTPHSAVRFSYSFQCSPEQSLWYSNLTWTCNVTVVVWYVGFFFLRKTAVVPLAVFIRLISRDGTAVKSFVILMSAVFPSAQLPEICKGTVQPQLKVPAKPFQSSLQNMLVRNFFGWLYTKTKKHEKPNPQPKSDSIVWKILLYLYSIYKLYTFTTLTDYFYD